MTKNNVTDPDQSSTSKMFSNRIEDKYIVNVSDFDLIIEVIEDHLKPSYKVPCDYTLISSTYLDSTDLKFLKQQFSDSNTKYKLRVRGYAPDGKWQDDKYLEVKYSVDGVKKKKRVCVDMWGYTEALGGNPIPDKMRKLNEDLPEGEFDSAKALIDQITNGGLSPVTKVTYKRLSYEKGDLRATLDRKLTIEGYATAKNFQPSSDIVKKISEVADKFDASSQGILEIKHHETGDCPDWLTSLIKKYKQGESGFSKYVWGLDKVIR